MTKKQSPQEKLKKYQEKITSTDLKMAIAEIQRICNFKPKLNTKGNMNYLKNQIYLIANSLYPEDSKIFSNLTNWVLYRLQIRGWTNKEYTKPHKNTLLDLEVATRSYTQKDLPTFMMNNYEYPYKNVFENTDADDTAWCVNYILQQERSGANRNSVPMDKGYIYGNVLRAVKYIQLWCQLYNFDIRIGIDRSDTVKHYVTTNHKFERLRKIEEEVRSGVATHRT